MQVPPKAVPLLLKVREAERAFNATLQEVAREGLRIEITVQNNDIQDARCPRITVDLYLPVSVEGYNLS